MATLALHARESELASLDELIAGAADGGGVLVVRGEAGIGKSTLLAAARDRADAAGMAVLSAAGVQSEAQLPFAGLHQLLQPLLGDLDALPGPHRTAIETAFGMTDGAAPHPFVTALATLELLGEAAARSPLLVVAEDAHWLDRPTTDVLAFVARRVNLEPIVLLLAVRDDATNPFETADLPELRLDPLDRRSAGELLDAHAPELAPAIRERLLDEAAGNPLALVELPAAVESQLGETSVLPEHLPLSARLERAFAARLPELPEASRALLLAAATDGHSVVEESIDVAERVLGRPVSAEALEPARELRLVDLEPSRVRFRHPLVRSAVYIAATPAERGATHLALAAVLADDPDRSVWHRAAAATQHDETLAADLEASAERAQRRGAIATAVAALQRAAELCDGPERVRRLLLAAELAFELGRRDIALPLLAKVEPLELTALERGRMTLIREMVDPRPLDAPKVRALVDAATLAADEGDRDLALDLLWLVASRCWWSFLGEEQRLSGLAAAEALGTIEEDERVLAIVAYLAPLERGEALTAALSRASGGAERDPLGRGLLATAAFATGAFDLADALLADTAARLRSQGRLGHLPRLLVLQGTTAARMPDWNIAIPAAEEGERLASELGQPAWIAGAQTVEAYLAALRGDEQAAEAAASAAERVALPLGANFLLTSVQWARGLAALGAGRHADAYAELRRTHDPQDPSFHHHMRWWAISDLADAAVHGGNVAEGRRMLDELSRLARTPRRPGCSSACATRARCSPRTRTPRRSSRRR